MQFQVNETHPGNRDMRARLSVPMAVFFTVLLLPVFAVAQTDIWLGGAGNWSNGSMWSAGAPTSTSNVFIDNGNPVQSPVTLDIQGLANNLTIDSDDSLSFNNSTSLTVSGGSISDAGQITINATAGAFTYLTLANNTMLSGGGTVTLSTGNTGGTDAFIQGAATLRQI